MSPQNNRSRKNREVLLKIYDILYKIAGPRHWWPGDTDFEVMIGAILTQNTSWKNVEKAISNLKKAKLLSFRKLSNLPTSEIAELIRPSGYYNQKAKRLKILTDFMKTGYGGSIEGMKKAETHLLREEFLSLNGIGMETADSILLYALEKPVFVVDLYTKRILSRHGILPFESSYEEIQGFFMENLDAKVSLYNEYHALLVYAGNRFCRKNPLCEGCPLLNLLPQRGKRKRRI